MAALSIGDAARRSPRRFGREGQSKESSNTLRINEASQHVLSLLPTSSGSSEELFFSAEINKPYHDSSTSLQSNSGFLSTCKMESTDSLTFETVASSCNNSSGTYAFNKVKVQKNSKKMYSPVSTTKTGKKGRKFSAQSTMAESVGQKARESKSYLTYAAIFALLAASWFYLAFTCPRDEIVYHTQPNTMDRLRELFSIKYVYPYGPPPV
ncbi:Protein of unknown function [Gryllus bimaculatus]|nr:Protein of unknown function [Gryllus bimaculatus]